MNSDPVLCKKYLTLRKGPISIGGSLYLTPVYLIFKSPIGYDRFMRFDNIESIERKGKKVKKVKITLKSGKSYNFLTWGRDDFIDRINVFVHG